MTLRHQEEGRRFQERSFLPNCLALGLPEGKEGQGENKTHAQRHTSAMHGTRWKADFVILWKVCLQRKRDPFAQTQPSKVYF